MFPKACCKDGYDCNHSAKLFCLKTFELEKQFMHESFLRFLRVGVRLRMLRLEMRWVPAVTLLNVDGFNVLDENTVTVYAGFSTSRDCIQLNILHVTFIVFFLDNFVYKSVLRCQKPIYNPTFEHFVNWYRMTEILGRECRLKTVLSIFVGCCQGMGRCFEHPGDVRQLSQDAGEKQRRRHVHRG